MNAQKTAGLDANVFARQDLDPRFLQGAEKDAGGILIFNAERSFSSNAGERGPAFDD